MTLVELLVAVAVSGIVFAAVTSFAFYCGRSFVALSNYVDLDNKSRSALDRMTQEIRQVNGVTGYGTATLASGQLVTNKLEFGGTEANGTAYTLTYEYSPTDQKLTRTKVAGSNAETTTLLTECYNLNFGMFQRNPVGGTYEQYPAADPSTCKEVQLSWICSRKILGRTANTESMQSAKVVIRKK
jgi:Tfp pilus assembly protein PilW